MSDHTGQLVGNLFRVLSEEGYTEAQRALLDAYDARATADREALTDDLLSELVAVLREEIDTAGQVSVLTEAVERLVTRFATVVETVPVAIVVVDGDGRIRVWNDGARRLFGWSDTEMRGERYPQALAVSDERVADGGSDGDASPDEFLSRLAAGERLHGVETRHVHENGAVRDVRVWGAPVETDEGSLDGAVFAVSDVTERRQREQRLAVLNRVLRHNIRTDVNVARGRLAMLADDPAVDDEHVAVIEERLSNIVALSDTARTVEQLEGEPAESTTFDLAAVVRDRVGRHRDGCPAAEVSVDTPETVPVEAHDLLPYALDNVLDNALEHNDTAEPRVAVDVTRETADGREWVVVHVADDGPGLPATERRVLTADTETPLTHSDGLGLWLTRWIVRSSDGAVAVGDSDLGGTRVSIRLPPSG
ncbi:PAS domain S-box protein [Halobaculum sp. MBLA0147]|uniref:PAS domain S-box protein n=1 Tax=Halobaculum sp. MBLA0147 TaxID=3079934 RepID=UPI003524F2ED